MRHRGACAAAAFLATGVLTVLVGMAPAVAGTTTPSSSITTVGHGASMPAFSVTVADSFGTMDGAFFRISDAWRVDASSLRPTQVQWSGPGTCGIASMVDGNGHSLTSSQHVSCIFKFTTVGFFNLRIETESASVPSPITVTFTAGVLTAPAIAPSSTWTVGSVNNTDGSTPAPLIFNLVDLAVTPEAQYISCAQGVPMESAPLVPSGFTGTVSYDLLDDVPPGIVFDPATGVVSGTPHAAVAPNTIRIKVTSSTTAGSVTATVGLNVSPPTTTVPTTSTTTPPQTRHLPATGLEVLPILVVGGALALVGAELLMATRRTRRP